VRIIAATNRDLYAMVEKGLFREDLYYRLCVLALAIPPLRDRKEDIPDIVRYHMARKGWETRMNARSITEEAMELLIAQDWPGNVRQLENVVERCVFYRSGGAITRRWTHARDPLLCPASPQGTAGRRTAVRRPVGVLRSLERHHSPRLSECGGNGPRPPGSSHHPTTLWRRLENMGHNGLESDGGGFPERTVAYYVFCEGSRLFMAHRPLALSLA
jgi:DNA-binding NtrC family response regulator